MKSEILSEIENNVIGRTEYCFLISFEGATPSKQKIREELKVKVGTSPDLFVIRKIEPLAGRKAIKVYVHSYSDSETLRRVEPLYILKRNGLIKENNESKS